MKILILLLSFLSASAYAMDSVKCEQILTLMDEKKWEEAKSEIDAVKDLEDPEYYALILNYYLGKAEKPEISIERTSAEDGNETLVCADSTGQKYYLAGEVCYNMDEVNEGLEQFRPALTKFPSRLDFHIGLVYASEEFGLYKETEDCLINILKVSKEIDNKWLWSYNEPLEDRDAKKFMFENLQVYISQLSLKERPETDSIAFYVSEQMINLYPEEKYGYDNIGSLYIMQGKDDKALEYFLKSLKIDPDDVLVLAGLAHTYFNLGNIETAKYYLYKVIETGDESYSQWAKGILDELENASEEEDEY